MKLNLTMFSLFVASLAVAAPDFSMVGFATLEGGTTGGKGGTKVVVNNFADLKKYAEDLETPYIIIVEGEINTGIATFIDDEGHVASSGTATTYGELISVGNNKTIVGKGSDAFLNRIGLSIQKKHNIIIRNIKFTMSDVPISKTDENKVVAYRDQAEVILNDPDCISIQADSAVTDWLGKSTQASYNIWIDHCEFYNNGTGNKDRYDGLLDAKNNIYNATFSWNYFHDHEKGSLIGNSNGDSLRHEVTIHHNYYKNIESRTPMMRHSNSHLYNNYVEGAGNGNGPNVRYHSDLYFEKNHYAGLSKAIFAGDDGVATIVDNKYEGCGNMSSDCNSKKMSISLNPGTTLSTSDTVFVSLKDEIPVGSFKPSTYYSYTADDVNDVKSLVTTYAGVGKIDISEYENASPLSIKSSKTLPNTSIVDIQVVGDEIMFKADAGSPIKLFSMNGTLLLDASATGNVMRLKTNLPSGIYLLKSGSFNKKISIK